MPTFQIHEKIFSPCRAPTYLPRSYLGNSEVLQATTSIHTQWAPVLPSATTLLHIDAIIPTVTVHGALDDGKTIS